RANVAVRDLEYATAEELSRRILETAGADERLTRARALSALGRALCWRLDENGRRDEAVLREAEEHLKHASRIYLSLGMRSAVSGNAPYLAIWLEFARGDAQGALQTLEEALGLVADRPRRRAYVMCFMAEVHAELGLHDECEA